MYDPWSLDLELPFAAKLKHESRRSIWETPEHLKGQVQGISHRFSLNSFLSYRPYLYSFWQGSNEQFLASFFFSPLPFSLCIYNALRFQTSYICWFLLVLPRTDGKCWFFMVVSLCKCYSVIWEILWNSGCTGWCKIVMLLLRQCRPWRLCKAVSESWVLHARLLWQGCSWLVDASGRTKWGAAGSLEPLNFGDPLSAERFL